jgi:hypothetical protein
MARTAVWKKRLRRLDELYVRRVGDLPSASG